MNGAHDMGGMDGFGPVRPEIDEPVFHEPWHARAMALTVAMAAHRRWTLDAMRSARERLGAIRYLNLSYYERWILALTERMVATGLVTRGELASGTPEGAPGTPPLRAEGVMPMLLRGGPTARELAAPPRFAPGDQVRTSRAAPAHHTRLPRYARGAQGVVVIAHGGHVFADTSAQGLGEAPQHLYAVRFAARALWGDRGDPRDSVTLDIWESLLDPA